MIHPKNSGSSDRIFRFKIPHKVSQDEGTTFLVAENVRTIRITLCVLSIRRFGFIRKYLFQTAQIWQECQNFQIKVFSGA